MNLDVLERVIELARRHGLHQLEVQDGGLKISVTVAASPASPSLSYPAFAPQPVAPSLPSFAATAVPPPPQAAPAAAPRDPGKTLRSPFVGTFYRSASPGAEPFAAIGKRVRKGDTLCIIEAMKLMNEIEAEADGVIREILVDNEQPVEFDQPLFVME